MTNTNRTESKMTKGIRIALELIEEGKYIVDYENGTLSNGRKVIGSLDRPSGNIFHVIKGIDILSHRLMYAVYHGFDALDDSLQVKHVDGDKTNNRPNNLVQIPRKGAKAIMEQIRSGELVPPELQAFAVSTEDEVEEVQEELTQEMIDLFDELDTIEEDAEDFTEKELLARRIMHALNANKSIKEVAEQFEVSKYFVYDVKRGKSHGKATADLRN